MKYILTELITLESVRVSVQRWGASWPSDADVDRRLSDVSTLAAVQTTGGSRSGTDSGNYDMCGIVLLPSVGLFDEYVNHVEEASLVYRKNWTEKKTVEPSENLCVMVVERVFTVYWKYL